MALENLVITRKHKETQTEELTVPVVDQKEVHNNNYARTHVPNVFEHQYAEYISGLKPPYLSLGKGRKDEDE